MCGGHDRVHLLLLRRSQIQIVKAVHDEAHEIAVIAMLMPARTARRIRRSRCGTRLSQHAAGQARQCRSQYPSMKSVYHKNRLVCVDEGVPRNERNTRLSLHRETIIERKVASIFDKEDTWRP